MRKTKAQASAIKAKNEFTESQTSKKDPYREYNMMPQPSSYHPQHIAPLQHLSPHQGTLQMPQVPQQMAPLPPPPSSQMVPPPLTHPQQQQLRHTRPMRPVTQQHITSPQIGQIQHMTMPQPSQGIPLPPQQQYQPTFPPLPAPPPPTFQQYQITQQQQQQQQHQFR